MPAYDEAQRKASNIDELPAVVRDSVLKQLGCFAVMRRLWDTPEPSFWNDAACEAPSVAARAIESMMPPDCLSNTAPQSKRQKSAAHAAKRARPLAEAGEAAAEAVLGDEDADDTMHEREALADIDVPTAELEEAQLAQREERRAARRAKKAAAAAEDPTAAADEGEGDDDATADSEDVDDDSGSDDSGDGDYGKDFRDDDEDGPEHVVYGSDGGGGDSN